MVASFRSIIGEPRDTGPLVVAAGESAAADCGTLTLEDGSAIEISDALPRDLPLGYHTLRSHEREQLVIVAPARCHLPEHRSWGWAVQLYAARSTRSWGIGDLRDLDDLAGWATDVGAGFVLVNPLLAVAPTTPIEPSPYSPSTRCFRNVLHLDVEGVPGAAEVASDWRPLAERGRALNSTRRIDRDEVWRLKRAALTVIWRHVRDRVPEFRRWMDDQPPGLVDFATWCVLAEEFGPDSRRWPPEHDSPNNAATVAFRASNADRVDFHAWLQWCSDRQLGAVTGRTALVQDLPVGFDPGGADAWRWRDLLADGASIGAPPDEFNVRGQDWGLPPFVPWRLRAANYAPFIETLRAVMPKGGGLRIDHVMGLFRQWWVPVEDGPDRGAYVRFPAEELLAIVALESRRAGAFVVGEDLGTVEEGVRESMARHHLLSYRLLWFEEDAPELWPPMSMAAVTTHDLPTVVGLWTGRDLDAQRDAGVNPNVESTQQMRDRVARTAGIADDHDLVEVVARAHQLLATSPSLLLSATLDDAVLEPERPNMPGADENRPNWSLALPVPIEAMRTSPAAPRVIESFQRALVDDGRPAPDEVEHDAGGARA